MASEIKVDTIVNAGGDNDTGIDLATNDQILLKVANATKLTMNSTGQTTIVGEGGTTTTSVQQGLVKAWVNYTTISSTGERDSFNISSLTDNGTGNTTININNDMANTNYSVWFFTNATSTATYTSFSNHYTGGCADLATGLFKTMSHDATNAVDASINFNGVAGDLA